MKLNDNLDTVMNSSFMSKIILIHRNTHSEDGKTWKAIEILYDLERNNIRKLWYNDEKLRDTDYETLVRKVY